MGSLLHFSFFKYQYSPYLPSTCFLFYSPVLSGGFRFLFYPEFTLVNQPICRRVGLTGAYLVITSSGTIVHCIYSDILEEETEILRLRKDK